MGSARHLFYDEPPVRVRRVIRTRAVRHGT